MRVFPGEFAENSESIPAYFPLDEKREIQFRSDVVARRGVTGDKSVLLGTLAGLNFIDAGASTWQLDPANRTCIVPDTSPHRVVVDASWYSAEQTQAASIKVVAGADANVFAGMGALLVPDGFHIPAVEATTDNVKFYGLSLLDAGEPFVVESDEYDLALMEFVYEPEYREDFLTQTRGGGGYYVEFHNFPHLHVPMNEEAGGYIVIGKQLSEHQFAFTAFRIPFGKLLYTPSGTIHGDGTLVGTYAITVASSAAEADTVLFYNKHTVKKADGVVPPWPQ